MELIPLERLPWKSQGASGDVSSEKPTGDERNGTKHEYLWQQIYRKERNKSSAN